MLLTRPEGTFKSEKIWDQVIYPSHLECRIPGAGFGKNTLSASAQIIADHYQICTNAHLSKKEKN